MKDKLDRIKPNVKEALENLDRSRFVPEVLMDESRQDRPVPIGFGQTCSQPRLVAYMTDLLEIDEGSRVLEIGTGCGFQTALLLELGCLVFSIEIFNELADQSRERLENLGYNGFKIRVGDGSSGWPDEAPFDACIFTCAAKKLPKAIIKQVKTGGRIVFPHEVGKQSQELIKAVKLKNGRLDRQFTTSVLFVPLLNEKDADRRKR